MSDARSPASVEITVSDETGFYSVAVAAFSSALRNSGVQVESTPCPKAPVQLAGPLTTIVISIDPATIKQIFEYSLQLVAAYKAADYVGEFLKGLASKSGEAVGETLTKALVHLGHDLYRRLFALTDQGRHSRFILSFESRRDDIGPVDLTVSFFPTYRDHMSEEEFARSLAVLSLSLLPVVDMFGAAASANGFALAGVSAFLTLGRTAGEPWNWSVHIRPIGDFWIDRLGVLRPADPADFKRRYARWNLLRRLRIARRGIDLAMIPRIVESFARRQR